MRRKMLYAALSIFALLQLFPLLWLINYSLVKSGELFGPEILKWPNPFQWGNYTRAWIDGRIALYLWNSTVVVVSSVAASTVFSFMIAYACTRMKWRLRGLVYAVVMLGMVVPIHTTLLPNFIWFRTFGIINRRIALVIPYVAFTLSFNTLVFSGMLATFPRSVEEAAWIEGAGMSRLLSSIVAPLAMPAFATVSIMTFLNNWNEFIMAYTFIAADRLRTLPFSIIRFQGQYSSDYAVQFACMALVAAVPIVLYFVFNRWIVAGATAGAVKG
jgi:raffinose/stachyose/melibiose transport system permease protein